MPTSDEVDGPRVLEFMRHGIGPDSGGEPRLVRLAKRVVPHGHRDRLRLAVTRPLHPRSRRRAARVLERGPVLLNLGSGYAPVDGWVNVDLVGAPVDLPWDLRHGLPFPDASVDGAYSAHVFEHIPLAGALALFEEVFRVLRPGAPVRIVVPDAGELLDSYAGTGSPEWVGEYPTRMLAVNALFYYPGHASMWDAELLTEALRGVGFTEVAETAYGETALHPCPDIEERRAGSLYVEGRRP